MTTPVQNFGRDIAVISTATGPDIDLSRVSTGIQTVSNSLYCRLTTPHGSVVDAPNECFDLRKLLGAGLSQAGLQNVQTTIQRQCERDERVLAAAVIAAYDQASQTLSATLQITTAQGPFLMTLSVNNLTVALITASAAA